MQIVNLQIAPTAVNPVINVSQYDVGRQFQLKLYDGSVAYNLPTGATARIEGIKPDSKVFSYMDAVSVSGNTLTITTKEQMTILFGTVYCEIRISKAGTDIGTLNFWLVVEKSPMDGDIDISDTEIPAIIELAREQEHNAEAWAVGTKGGIPVASDEPQFQNNSKFYAEQAKDSADQADSDAETAHEQAAIATNKATEASASATLSESWAVGGTGSRPGEDVNNSWYWSLQSASHASEIETYIAIIRTLFDKVYLDAESGDRLLTESGDNILIDF